MVEQYDVFNKENKNFIVTLKEAGKSWGKTITLESKEKSPRFTIKTTIGRGDGRYSRARSGSFKFKFDHDDKIYSFSGTSYYLRTVYADRDKNTDKEFLEKLSQKNYVYVKVNIVGTEHVFKINLKGSRRLLKTGKFLK